MLTRLWTMWSKQLLEALSMEGACHGVWNPWYLSKQHPALGFTVLGGGGRVSFDINATALVDNNGSCGPEFFDSNWSLCAKFFIFIFILIHWSQFLPHTGASFHPIKSLSSISVFPFPSLLWHMWANKLSTGAPSWHLSPLLDSQAAVRAPPLLAEELYDHDVTTAQLEDPSMNQDLRGNEWWSPKATKP